LSIYCLCIDNFSMHRGHDFSLDTLCRSNNQQSSDSINLVEPSAKHSYSNDTKVANSADQLVEVQAVSNGVIMLLLRNQDKRFSHARRYVTTHRPPLAWLCSRLLYFSLPATPPPALGGGEVALPRRDASLPSAASRSRKSCHSSASDSLLLELLAINIGSDIEFSEGVLGVRRKGDMGIRREEPEDVPGRARPACSRCSD
jgi:hypothetical protein